MAYKYLNDDGLKAYTKKVKGALKDLHTPIAISTLNTTESKAQNVRNIADFIAKAKAAGIADVNGMAVTCLIDTHYSGVGYLYMYTPEVYVIQGILIKDDLVDNMCFSVFRGEYTERGLIVSNDEKSLVTPSMLDTGARNPIILTSSTAEVDEGTYQKLLVDDVDVVFKADDGEYCALTYKEDAVSYKRFYFTCLSAEGGNTIGDIYIYAYEFNIAMTSPHTCTITTLFEAQPLDGLIETEFIHKSILTPVPLTATTSTNKTQLDLFLSKVPNAQVMHCTYKDVYAGTLHKIGTDWFGLLVKNTNNYEDALQVKLQADGTLIEGTTSLAQVNAKLANIIG